MATNKVYKILVVSLVTFLVQNAFSADTMIGKKVIKSLGKITYQGKSYSADLVIGKTTSFGDIAIDVENIGVLLHGFRYGLDQVLPVIENLGNKKESVLCSIITKNKAIHASWFLAPPGRSHFNFTDLVVEISGRTAQIINVNERKTGVPEAMTSLRCYSDFEVLDNTEGGA